MTDASGIDLRGYWTIPQAICWIRYRDPARLAGYDLKALFLDLTFPKVEQAMADLKSAYERVPQTIREYKPEFSSDPEKPDYHDRKSLWERLQDKFQAKRIHDEKETRGVNSFIPKDKNMTSDEINLRRSEINLVVAQEEQRLLLLKAWLVLHAALGRDDGIPARQAGATANIVPEDWQALNSIARLMKHDNRQALIKIKDVCGIAPSESLPRIADMSKKMVSLKDWLVQFMKERRITPIAKSVVMKEAKSAGLNFSGAGFKRAWAEAKEEAAAQNWGERGRRKSINSLID